ncbi:hypothetical protein SUGI_0145350 [Cryptomeria japonica]|uniref:transcription factor bHLH75 isoform X2 n=1 Tax=Cryptomeria japonica TaxID=3369 RepID=UPI002408AB53|nr:transcription factor bHLH75 isoform X2 [Cryptomeria japonica]GLJ11172.1 hypothetical protein SUGI_0145350 [Cryptomeria japonica]
MAGLTPFPSDDGYSLSTLYGSFNSSLPPLYSLPDPLQSHTNRNSLGLPIDHSLEHYVDKGNSILEPREYQYGIQGTPVYFNEINKRNTMDGHLSSGPPMNFADGEEMDKQKINDEALKSKVYEASATKNRRSSYSRDKPCKGKQVREAAAQGSKKLAKAEGGQNFVLVRARRGQATDRHSIAERVRREKIRKRMRFLQDLVPGCCKANGKTVVLDEIINYVKSLQNQIEFLSMKLCAASLYQSHNEVGHRQMACEAGYGTTLGMMEQQGAANCTLATQPLEMGMQSSIDVACFPCQTMGADECDVRLEGIVQQLLAQ